MGEHPGQGRALVLRAQRQFGCIKVRYRGPKKNSAQIVTLFALTNLWMPRWQLLEAQE